MDVYGIAPDGPSAFDERLAVVEQLCETAARRSPQPMLAFSAGYFTLSSVGERDELSEHLRRLSGLYGVAIVYGVTVEPPQDGWPPLRSPGDGWIYAVDSGLETMSASRQRRRREEAIPWPRVVSVGGERLAVIASSEVFQPALRFAIVDQHPTLAVLLAHGGVGARWLPALRAWERVVPLLIIGQSASVGPKGWVDEPGPRADGVVVTVHRREQQMDLPFGRSMHV